MREQAWNGVAGIYVQEGGTGEGYEKGKSTKSDSNPTSNQNKAI